MLYFMQQSLLSELHSDHRLPARIVKCSDICHKFFCLFIALIMCDEFIHILPSVPAIYMDKKIIYRMSSIRKLLRKLFIIVFFLCRKPVKICLIFCSRRTAEDQFEFFLMSVNIFQYKIRSFISGILRPADICRFSCFLYAVRINRH